MKKLEWMEFDSLEPHPDVLHATFLRHGGVSQGPCASLNIGANVGDHPDSVRENREIIRNALNLEHLLFANQVHGATIHCVTSKNLSIHPQADGLITDLKGVGLAIAHADCQAALFYDPKKHIIGIAHAGWKGSAQNIYAQMVAALRDLHCDPKNLLVAISPSLGPDHYECKNYKTELPQDFWSFQVKPNYFNFWDISRKQLTECGIPAKNIEIAEMCTFCNEKDFFSYRRDKNTGRNASVIALK